MDKWHNKRRYLPAVDDPEIEPFIERLSDEPIKSRSSSGSGSISVRRSKTERKIMREYEDDHFRNERRL